VVVILPDSGERYLTKIYNDDWMREHGFLTPERITARYVLQSKGRTIGDLIAIDPVTTVRKALDLIKEHDVSQLPVLERGKPVGGVHDYELMTTVLERPALINSPVSAVMGPTFPLVNIDSQIEDVIRFMTSKKNSAVLVEENEKINGIITRYDVIEFMGK
jgi:cystathionine beta-synthase